ncbi:MAG: hypothetical protein CMF59_09845 [Leptospiraceae bacterium]|nr:hypothetical protein [Leptospiraceae bacterium]
MGVLSSQGYGLKLDRIIEPVYLQASDGKHVSFPPEGQTSLVFLGFIQCPTICPRAMRVLQQTISQAKQSDLEVSGVFVSIDPERDSLEALASWRESLRLPVQAYRPETRKEAKGLMRSLNGTTSNSGAMEHSAFLYLFDRDGKLRRIYPHENPSIEGILADIEQLSKETREKDTTGSREAMLITEIFL